MTAHNSLGRSTRLARWWVRRYTAGLSHAVGARRQAEIDSDLAEHHHCRTGDDWTAHRIARERVSRLIRGIPADLAWRHDLLHRGTNRLRTTAVGAATGAATLMVAAFHFAFAAYLLGATSLTDRRFLGRMDAYADEVGRPVASAIAATIIATLGLILVIAAVARPVSPLIANAATISVAGLSVMFFWLGVWPISLVAVIGSVTDLAVRGSATTPPP